MRDTVEWVAGSEELTDSDLTALALAADRDMEVDEDALPLESVLGLDDDSLLPDWYMPVATNGVPPLRGWRRRTAVLIVSSFTAVTAYGLCATYGHVGLF